MTEREAALVAALEAAKATGLSTDEIRQAIMPDATMQTAMNWLGIRKRRGLIGMVCAGNFTRYCLPQHIESARAHVLAIHADLPSVRQVKASKAAPDNADAREFDPLDNTEVLPVRRIFTTAGKKKLPDKLPACSVFQWRPAA